jgi:prepilin peptidase CpaA
VGQHSFAAFGPGKLGFEFTMSAPHEVVWMVSLILVEAAVIDGWKLRVPNWLTFHLIIGGLAFAAWQHGAPGFIWALQGTVVGLALLLPLYSIGGMGAGDVKLLAGVGAWVGPAVTFWAFATSAVVGGAMALVMVAWSGDYIRHWVLFQAIGHEILSLRNPTKLAASAAERKPNMMLLPYGIPLAAGSIAYFVYAGLLA